MTFLTCDCKESCGSSTCYDECMRIFCSGIGGIGLSAYASHMHALGHDVSGSDRSDSAILTDLQSQGVATYLEQNGKLIEKNIELLVYSEAVPESSPERRKAKELGIRQYSYFEALGELTRGKDVIAVSGTHGKSSTTAMLARIFTELGADPNVVVGTKMKEFNGRNWRKGAGDLWILEACEYRRSFLHLEPKTLVITNVDGDHFDAFKDADDYRSAFVEFASKLPEGGVIVGHGADLAVRDIANRSKKTFIDADAEALISMKTPGLHMQMNAQLALAVSRLRGLPVGDAERALQDFQGTWRRMEMKGTSPIGVTVIDDYGHHPTEIRATLSAIKNAYRGKKLVCVYQPHTNDRTLKLWGEFVTAFRDADEVVLTDVYDARPEKDAGQVDMKKLAADIQSGSSGPCIAAGSISQAEAMLRTKILKTGDIALVMGAGDVTELAGRLLT